MPAFDPRDRGEVGAARGDAGYGIGRRDGGGGDRARSIDTRSLNPNSPGWGALGPRGPMGRWGTDPSFQKAMNEYNDRGFFNRAADFFAGPFYDAVKPQPLSPKTYAGGTYHTGTNVPGVAGGMLGNVLGGPLGGMILGRLAGMIPGGTVMHGGNPALAGFNTGTGAPGTAPGSPQGGSGNQWALLAQRGPMAATPATPRMGLMR
jgi:hypothetical protein